MFELPDLPYSFDALEPHIDKRTMELHHDKHHGTYVQKLNEALEGQEGLMNTDINTLIQKLDQVPEDKQRVVRNNGGGHANHSLFWQWMSPDGGGEPSGELAKAINDNFGNFDDFKTKFKESATTLFGSGWTWLVKGGNGLEIIQTPLQDNPLMNGQNPILGLDVWEHAYYLKYQNRRPDYIESWWNVVDWSEVARHYQESRH